MKILRLSAVLGSVSAALLLPQSALLSHGPAAALRGWCYFTAAALCIWSLGRVTLLVRAHLPVFARARSVVEQEPYLLRFGLQVGVHGLVPGAKYRVIQAFEDCYGERFVPGQELTFVERHYLPYHGGHTLIFLPRSIYLQDEENADVLHGLNTYLQKVA